MQEPAAGGPYFGTAQRSHLGWLRSRARALARGARLCFHVVMNDTRIAPSLLEPDYLMEVESAAAKLAAEAGALLLERFRTVLTIEYKGGDHHNPVTNADHEAERFLRESIIDRFPSHGVL